MFRMRRYRWFAVLSLGIMAGFSLGVGLTSYLTNTSSPHLAAQAKFAELKLHASTAMGSETFAMSTGQIDNETEARSMRFARTDGASWSFGDAKSEI